jgi:hypothetical protein
MKKIALALMVGFALFLVPVFAAPTAADVTGKWTGSFVITTPDGENRDESAFMDLKQAGTELTGTAGPNADKQYAILKGKVDGNKVTFEVQAEVPLIKFELTLVDNHLKGEANVNIEGEARKASLDLQRVTK